MKCNKLILAAVSILLVTGCGDFLQNDPNLPPVYVSALKVECMDATNGAPNCTEPVIFFEAATGTYITRFDHNPQVSASSPITLHIDVRNTGATELSTNMSISYNTRKNPCDVEPCSSGEAISNSITLQPGEARTFDIPIQNPLAGGPASATVVWSRPDEISAIRAGMAYFFFGVQ